MPASFLKSVGILCGVLLVAWVFYMYRQVPHRVMPFANTIDTAAFMRIEQGGQHIQLMKEKNEWKIEFTKDVYVPVDEIPWKTLTTGLKQVALEDEISDRSDRAAEYEVDTASGTRIILKDAAGKTLTDGVFGKQASNFIHIYYRPSGQDKIYMARGIYRPELGKTDPYQWRARDLVNIPESEIKRIRIERKGRLTELVRVSSTSWTSNGKAVEVSVVNGLLGTLAHLRADNFIDPKQYPSLTYESLSYARLQIEGEKSSVDVHIGPLQQKTIRYPLSTGKSNGLAWLSQATLDPILKF